jgi:hypothetical protein
MRAVIFFFCTLSFVVRGQIVEESGPHPFPESWYPRWPALKGTFLEPDRFAIVYDKTPSRLRLEAGYGDEFLVLGRSAEKIGIGAEILIWSGLKMLNNFRFPVETADYFFGLYSVFPVKTNWWYDPLRVRIRLSHISSHLVDGAKDSLIGGSSSKFSREFVSLEALLDEYRKNGILLSAGVKYVVHQVNKFEPVFQFPITVNVRLHQFNSRISLNSFMSTAAGPAFPTYSGGLVFRRQTGKESGFEVYAEYHSGHSRYGVDGDRNEDGFEFGVRFCGFPEGYSYY